MGIADVSCDIHIVEINIGGNSLQARLYRVHGLILSQVHPRHHSLNFSALPSSGARVSNTFIHIHLHHHAMHCSACFNFHWLCVAHLNDFGPTFKGFVFAVVTVVFGFTFYQLFAINIHLITHASGTAPADLIIMRK